MRNVKLFTGVALAALIAGAPGAFAQSADVKIADDSGENVSQTTTNNVAVTVIDGELTVGNLTGLGASAPISATGALSSVSGTFINSVTEIDVGDVTQITKQKKVGGLGSAPEVGNTSSLEVGNIAGNGATASSSATAAVSAVSVSFINAGGDVTIDDVSQTTIADTGNTGLSANNPVNTFGPSGPGITANGVISGAGASLSGSATGAASVVSVTGIGDNAGTKLGTVDIDEVTQTTRSDAKVSEKFRVGGVVQQVSGAGASASLSATGAQSAVAVTRIGGTFGNTTTDIEKVTQTTEQTGNVMEEGSFQGNISGGITGNGASVSISASGAVSAVSVASINTKSSSDIDIAKGDRVRQVTTNSGDQVVTRSTGGDPKIEGGNISGVGASASISASGAASAVSVSSINDGAAPSTEIGNVTQITTNSAEVRTESGTINVGKLSGAGASASVGASGATASISVSSINAGVAPSTTIGNVNQTTTNSANIDNNGGSITVGNLTQNGTGASINASGATSSGVISGVNVGSGSSTTGSVTQTTSNTGTVTGTGGVISAGNLGGNGSSASISATGAASAVSVSTIN